MVRVISVHHFASQHILTVEQPTAATIAPPNRLLLALSSHCIEVRDLKLEGDVLFTFPTVDEVAQLKHCNNGNYVATLESKFNRQNRELNFVRVYLNWDNIAALQQDKMNHTGASLELSECGMVQPMRARIAGRVTPTTNQSELCSLEMIEIPTKENPTLIEVCQASGNIIIAAKNILTIYEFQVKTHDISKLKFIDFEEIPISIELAFVPVQIALVENYVACMSKSCMHMFQVIINPAENEVAEQCDNDSQANFKYNTNDTINFKKLLEDEKMNLTNENITVHLPSILRDNSAIHRHSPFTFCDKDLTALITTISPKETNSVNFSIGNLIQLQLKPILIENENKQITEEFKCLVLKPWYWNDGFLQQKLKADGQRLKSNFCNNLHSISCLIATQQEGYMYQFPVYKKTSLESDNCITVYPFTATVQQVVMEDYFLHALTETGLETYTLRTGHKMFENVSDACPTVDEAVCLVGLRPFIGIETLLLDDNYLVLLACADNSSSPAHSVNSSNSSNTSYWTMYNLELPSPKNIFNDISITAHSHQFSSAQTFCHLMSEAHVILRTALIVSKLRKSEHSSYDELKQTYLTSCALLADHYILSNVEHEHELAIKYYKMAGVNAAEVIKRVQKLQLQSNLSNMNGLIFYLRKVLFDTKFNSDLLISTSKMNFAESVLELFKKHNFGQLPSLVLKVALIREYNTEKLIQILTSENINDEYNQAERTLALIILYNIKGNTKKAQELLQNIQLDQLFTVLEKNWELLFEHYSYNRKGTLQTFSELTIMLMTTHQKILADLFVKFIDVKRLSLNKLLKIFIEYLPSSIGNDASNASATLQKTLEGYFTTYFTKHSDLSKINYDRANHEGVKLLVRSYLSQLQLAQIKNANNFDKSKDNSPDNDEVIVAESDQKDLQQEKIKSSRSTKSMWGSEDNKSKKVVENYLFSNLRYEYLNKMPPFYSKHKTYSKSEEADLVLKKLQALLCSQTVPNQVLLEVNTFLSLNEELRGNESLQSIIMNVKDATLFLIECCPNCVLQFGKDRFTQPDEWKFLISTIQNRILSITQNDKQLNFYKKLLKDILTHVATSMSLEQLFLVFPQYMDYSTSYNEQEQSESDGNPDILKEIQNYEPYIILCKETMHANQIKKLITATGQQLLSTLNL